MRKSSTVALGITTLMAASFLGACGSSPSSAAVCSDKSGKRLADSACGCDDPNSTSPRMDDWTDGNGVQHRCSDGNYRGSHYHPGGGWFFFANGTRYPAVGESFNRPNSGYSGFSKTPPGGNYSIGGAPAGGGSSLSGSSIKGGTSVSKGGFGGIGGKSGG